MTPSYFQYANNFPSCGIEFNNINAIRSIQILEIGTGATVPFALAYFLFKNTQMFVKKSIMIIALSVGDQFSA